MPAFWHYYVAILTIIFVIWCAWLIGWSAKQGPKDVGDADLVGHKWDGDLEEWNKPAPKWWLYLYFITIAWGIGFLLAMPGLGNFPGLLGWSSTGQYDAEIASANDRFGPIYEKFAAMPFEELAADPEAQKLGASLYASYCTTCHGSDARGAKGFPNLADDDWIWGNSEAQLIQTINSGRTGVMPTLSAALGGDAGIDNMVTYVRSLSGLVDADAGAQSMQPMFVALCSACHMPDGTGNQMLGGLNLTDETWLYGSSEADVRETIVVGRNGMMPAHGNLLGDDRTKILAAYIYSLSAGE
jgi:cytochrome c oxidase cbb3-type subunit 3